MRLFIAILFSEDLRRALMREAERLRESAGGNFTRPENFHLTLAFIGESERVAELTAAIGEAAGPQFELTLSGGGRFGDTVWAGVEENPALSALSRRLNSALCARGFAVDRRPFRPHITLAREVVSRRATTELPAVFMTVSRISLMRSERINGRLTYTEIGGADLIAPA